ncbi:MucBP domain-containing protein [Lactococcus petauri]|uniref:MucBP domain-containing protein n=1 Tax=Lactococcus petauri TaxID=1940789 RepID=UPI003853F471
MKERLKNRYRERKGQIQLISFLTVLVVSVTFLGLAIPKIMAGDTQVSDLILQGESKEQSVTLTLKDEHPEDTKIVIPLPEGITYTSNSNPNIGVTYDELNKQLVIDWVEGEEKQIELQFEAEQEGRYDFTARTVRDGEPVTSSTCSVFIEETLDLKENTAPSIDLQNNEETIDSTTLKDNRNEEGSTETVSQIPGEFSKKELNRTLAGTFGERMSTSYSTDRYVTTFPGRFIPLASDLLNKEPVILKPHSVIASALKENFEWLVYDTTINFKFARLAGPAEIVGNSEGRETHILYSTDGVNFSEEIPDDFKEVKAVRTKIKMNMTTGFPNGINPEMPIDIIASPEWGEIETFASTGVSVWDKNNNLIDSSMGDRDHSFLVNQRQDINVNYVDTDGNKIREPQKFTDYVGFPYDVSTATYKPNITGYELDTSQLPENAKGTITAEPQTVTYVYNRKSGYGTVTIKYQDTFGKKIKDDLLMTGLVGASYREEPIDISGYKFKESEGPTEGVFTDSPATIIFIYTSASLRFYSVPEELEFNPTKIGNRTQTIERKDPTWKMVVEDNRLNKGTWRVTASLAEQFKDSSGQPLENNILIFSKGNQPEQWITSGSDVDVFDGKSSEDKELYDVSWNENEGPLLQVAPGAVKVGKYTGVITWQLVDAPV